MASKRAKTALASGLGIVAMTATYLTVPWEGVKTHAYWDNLGKVWTVCAGETKGVQKDDVYSKIVYDCDHSWSFSIEDQAFRARKQSASAEIGLERFGFDHPQHVIAKGRSTCKLLRPADLVIFKNLSNEHRVDVENQSVRSRGTRQDSGCVQVFMIIMSHTSDARIRRSGNFS